MKSISIGLVLAAIIICALLFQQHAPAIFFSIKRLGWMGPILFLLLYCLATLLLLPTMILTLAGGALFGPVLGTFYNLMGATLGAACAFCISRHLALNWLSAKRGPKLDKLISGVERRGWQFVAFLRLVPIIPFNLVNYGLGITRIKFNHYLITTLIFLTPAEFLYTYCGHAGMDALRHPNPLYRNFSLIILISLVFILLLVKFVHYLRN